MANAEDALNNDIVFRGTDGNECEAFVVAIRDRAFAQGMDEGDHWMLRYATSRLRGRAMRWHAKLDPSIKKDWDLFLQALFEEYPFVEERDEGGIGTPVWTSTTFSPKPSAVMSPSNNCRITDAQPTGTGAVPPGKAQSSGSPTPSGELAPPSRVYNPSLPGYQMGRLLIIYEEDRQGFHYISTATRATSNIHEALIVTFFPSSEPHAIGCFNGRNPKLAVELNGPNRSELHLLTEALSADSRVELSSRSWQTISTVWSISHDGTLRATMPTLVPQTSGSDYYVSGDYYLTTTAYVEISGWSILFGKDSNAPRVTNPLSGLPVVRARIVFESVR